MLLTLSVTHAERYSRLVLLMPCVFNVAPAYARATLDKQSCVVMPSFVYHD